MGIAAAKSAQHYPMADNHGLLTNGATMPELNLDYLNIDELPAHELELFANDMLDILDNAEE